MRELNFIDSNNPVDEQKILSAEAQIGFDFPLEYRKFLLKNNGGLAEEGIFDIPARGQSSVIFYGVDTQKEHSDLVLNFKAFQKRIPRKTLPIGFDPGGNLICIVAEDMERKIFFWDHEIENGTPILSNMFLLANSFSSFLDLLEIEDNDVW